MEKLYKSKKRSRKQPAELQDVLEAVNDGFSFIDAQFKEVRHDLKDIDGRFDNVDERLRGISTVLDGHTKKLEGLEQEKLFSFHAVQRLEKEIDRMKKFLHMGA